MRVFWKDQNLRYLGCNPAFARDAGKTHPDELIGKDDFEMAWAEQAEVPHPETAGAVAADLVDLAIIVW